MVDIFQKCFDYQEAKFVKASGLYPFFKPIEASFGSTVYYDGQPVVMIGSNNYLGLTHDSRVMQKAKEAIDRFGTGCTGSRFLNGNTVLHDALEQKLAGLVGKEDVLVFATGFLTNLGSIACLAEPNDVILSDSENHASIIEGCRLSKAKVVTYRHNDPFDLQKKLAEIPQEKSCLWVTDGVFSMTGDILNLPEFMGVKKSRPGLRMLIDDAHGLGVLGKKGEGTAGHFGLTEDVDLIMGTFSKSFASIGGFLAGPADVIDYVRHRARSFMFSAAMPPASVATVLACVEILEEEPWRLENLNNNVRYIIDGFDRISLAYIPSKTPIISVFIGDEGKAFKLVRELFENGIFATPVVYPAVPFGQALIRTSYMATHTEKELDQVLLVFTQLAHRYGIFKDQLEIPKELTHKTQSYSWAENQGVLVNAR